MMLDGYATENYLKRLEEKQSTEGSFLWSDTPSHPKMTDKVVKGLERLPGADVQPVRHGHWEKIGKPTWWGLYECSECNGITSIDYKYCPNCGAQMKD